MRKVDVDAPRVVTLDDQLGTLAAPEPALRLSCVALTGGRVRIEGTLALAWTSVADRVARSYEIAIALDAALITERSSLAEAVLGHDRGVPRIGALE